MVIDMASFDEESMEEKFQRMIDMQFEKQNKADTSDFQNIAMSGKVPCFYLSFDSSLFEFDNFPEEAFQTLYLSFCYAQGIEVDQSDVKAFEYLEKSASYDFDIAQNNLGYSYAYGIGTQQSKIRAFDYFKLAADKGNHTAILNISKCYALGFGTKKSIVRQISYESKVPNQDPLCKKLGHIILMLYPHLTVIEDLDNWMLTAREGNSVVQDHLIHLFSFSSEAFEKFGAVQCTKRLIDLLKEFSKLGNAEAQYLLGCYFGDRLKDLMEIREDFYRVHETTSKNMINLFRQYLPRSLEDSYYYLKLAADQGHPKAQILVGDCYNAGMGAKQSIGKSIYYYQLAADQNELLALERLTTVYEKSEFREKFKELIDHHNKKIFNSWKIEAKKGDSFAIISLGNCFERAIGTKRSFKKAFKFYKQASNLYNADGQEELGRCYENGIGVKKSEEKAIYYYKLASDQGNEHAKYCLAKILLEKSTFDCEEWAIHCLERFCLSDSFFNNWACSTLGYYFEDKQLKEKALYYFKIAADRGYNYAQYNVGCLYLENSKQADAFRYFKLAADQGDEDAKAIVEDLERPIP
jgi:TPR repeat protein